MATIRTIVWTIWLVGLTSTGEAQIRQLDAKSTPPWELTTGGGCRQATAYMAASWTGLCTERIPSGPGVYTITQLDRNEVIYEGRGTIKDGWRKVGTWVEAITPFGAVNWTQRTLYVDGYAHRATLLSAPPRSLAFAREFVLHDNERFGEPAATDWPPEVAGLGPAEPIAAVSRKPSDDDQAGSSNQAVRPSGAGNSLAQAAASAAQAYLAAKAAKSSAGAGQSTAGTQACSRPNAADVSGNRNWCSCIGGNFTSSSNYWTCRSANGTVLSACSSRGNGWQCQSQ